MTSSPSPKTARQILNTAKKEFKKHTGRILNVIDINEVKKNDKSIKTIEK